jgi:hypothetical protein
VDVNKKRLTKDETNVDIHQKKTKLLYKGSWEGEGGKGLGDPEQSGEIPFWVKAADVPFSFFFGPFFSLFFYLDLSFTKFLFLFLSRLSGNGISI